MGGIFSKPKAPPPPPDTSEEDARRAAALEVKSEESVKVSQAVRRQGVHLFVCL